MKNKIISAFLSIVLIVCSLSTVASASELKITEDAFIRIKLEPGKSVRISNPTLKDFQIKSEYKSDSRIETLTERIDTDGWNGYTWINCVPSYNIPKNNRTEFQLVSGEITLIIPAEYKDYVVQNNRDIFVKTTLLKNQSIIIENKYKGDAYLKKSNKDFKCERVEYIAGEIKKVDIEEALFVQVTGNRITKLGIKPDSNINSVELSLPYKLKDYIKVVDRPTLKSIDINPNESIESLNKYDSNSNKMLFQMLPIEGNEIQRYDKIEYDISYVTSVANEEQVSASFSGKYRITNKSKKTMQFIFDYDSANNIRKTSMPALAKYTVEPNKSYRFKNGGNISNLFIDNANKAYIDFLEITTKQDYATLETILDGRFSSIAPNTKWQIGSANNKVFDLYVPYEDKDRLELVSNPVFARVMENNGERFKVKNISNEKLSIYSESYIFDKYNITTYNPSYNRYETVSVFNDNTIRIDGGNIIYGDLKDGNTPQYYFAIPYEYKDKIGVYKMEDINEDNKIDLMDLAMLANEYNNNTNNKSYDLNGDGIVDIYDIVMVASKID